MVGKTTIANIISSRLQYACISTDDIGAAVASVTNPASHPAFHYMGGHDYREYYIVNNRGKLISDINRQHESLWPAVRTIFENHAHWGSPVVIEGWALRPSYVTQLSGNISGLFILADEELIASRTCSSDFSTGASDEEKMIQRYIERSLWYNSFLREQVGRLSLKSISVSLEMQPDQIADRCIRLLGETEKYR